MEIQSHVRARARFIDFVCEFQLTIYVSLCAINVVPL